MARRQQRGYIYIYIHTLVLSQKMFTNKSGNDGQKEEEDWRRRHFELTDYPLHSHESVAGDLNARGTSAGCVKSETVADGRRKKRSRRCGRLWLPRSYNLPSQTKQEDGEEAADFILFYFFRRREKSATLLLKTVSRIKPFPIGSSTDITDREMRSE